MNRRNYDAALPSKEEVVERHREMLESEGCDYCDEDDPDNLQQETVPMPNCTAVQKPPRPWTVVCDDHVDDIPSVRERAFETLEKRREEDFFATEAVGIVFFECQNWRHLTKEYHTFTDEEQVGWDDDGEPVYERVEMRDPRSPPYTQVPVECRCGADIDEIVWVEG